MEIEFAGIDFIVKIEEADQRAFAGAAFPHDSQYFCREKLKGDLAAGHHRTAPSADIGLKFRTGPLQALRTAPAVDFREVVHFQKRFPVLSHS
jgi:hypothetical protein